MEPTPIPPQSQRRARFLIKRLQDVLAEARAGEPTPARRAVLERTVRRCKAELVSLGAPANPPRA